MKRFGGSARKTGQSVFTQSKFGQGKKKMHKKKNLCMVAVVEAGYGGKRTRVCIVVRSGSEICFGLFLLGFRLVPIQK